MAKAEAYKSNRGRILAVYKILYEYTSEDHPITLEELCKKLEMDGFSADKQAVKADIEELIDTFDCDIQKDRKGALEYSVLSRDFELEEVKILVDCVRASKFLTAGKTKEIVDKLGTLCSRHEAKGLQGQVYVADRVKGANEDIYRNLDMIHKAIAQMELISFEYLRFSMEQDKELIPRYDERKSGVVPLAVVYVGEYYYLLAKAGTFGIRHFRIDKMRAVRSDGEDYWGRRNDRINTKESNRMDIEEYISQHFSMFGGKKEMVTIEFRNELLDAAIERFGKDITLHKVDSEHFKIYVNIVISQQFFGWLFGLGGGVRVLSPKSLVTDIRKYLGDIRELYRVARSSTEDV